MKLSKETQYGLTGILYLASQPASSVVSVADVAEATGLSFAFLAKIFNRLSRGGILCAYRGRSRGYALARPASELTIREVVETIESPNVFRHCVFWTDVCSETDPCALHELWLQVRSRVVKLMAETSVADLAVQQLARGVNQSASAIPLPGPSLDPGDASRSSPSATRAARGSI